MAGAPQQQQGGDNALAMLWGIIAAFVVMGLFWFFFHDWIAAFILKVRLIEVRFIASILPSHQVWVKELEALASEQLTFSDLAHMSRNVGRYLRFPISISLLGFAALIYLTRATIQFKQYYSMQTLVEKEQKNWAQISPVKQLDLVNTPLDEGPWAMALTPFQFAKENHLFQLEETKAFTPSVVSTISPHYVRPKLKRELARRVFTSQLKEEWQGIEALPLTTQSLLAVFAARALHDKEAANRLLNQLSRGAHDALKGEKNHQLVQSNQFSTQALLEKYQHHPLVTTVMKQHAYVLGVMASMLVLARQGGVLPSADFLWLKPYDRPLWFMLNCVGRKTAYVEVAGAFSHWVSECALKRKLKTPMIDTAVDALEAALKEVYLPCESQEVE